MNTGLARNWSGRGVLRPESYGRLEGLGERASGGAQK